MTVHWVEGDDEALVQADSTVVTVIDEASAAAALRHALSGRAVVIRAVGPRAVLDVLYDDLRRLTTVELLPAADPPGDLDDDERAVLEMIAEGRTMADTAALLLLSQRTAERRLATARAKLGAATTLAAVSRFRRRAEDQ